MQDEVYEWKTAKQLISELGEELALDLIERHKMADPNLAGKFRRRRFTMCMRA